MHKLRIGALGAGHHTSKVMLPAIEESPCCELTAIASKSKDLAQHDIRSHCDVQKYNDYSQLLNSELVDAIYIGLPNSLHVDWSINALKSGKHVLCEKPLALSAADAVRMKQAAKENGKVLMEAVMIRYHPVHARVEELLATNTIGRIQQLESEFCYYLNNRADIRLDAALGGGAAYDTLCYHLDICRRFLGESPEEIGAVTDFVNGVDCEAKFELKYPSGAQALLRSSLKSDKRTHRYILRGEHGSITVPKAFLISRLSEAAIEIRLTGKSLQTVRVPAVNQYCEMLNAFSQAVEGISDPGQTLDWSCQNAALSERLLAKAH